MILILDMLSVYRVSNIFWEVVHKRLREISIQEIIETSMGHCTLKPTSFDMCMFNQIDAVFVDYVWHHQCIWKWTSVSIDMTLRRHFLIHFDEWLYLKFFVIRIWTMFDSTARMCLCTWYSVTSTYLIQNLDSFSIVFWNDSTRRHMFFMTESITCCHDLITFSRTKWPFNTSTAHYY